MLSGQFQEPKNGWPTISDFYISCIGCAVSSILMLVIKKTTWNHFYSVCKEKEDKEVRIAKTKKAVDNCYRALYFIFASLWAYWICKDTEFLPLALGGKGDFRHMFTNYPSLDMPSGFKAFSLGQWAIIST